MGQCWELEGMRCVNADANISVMNAFHPTLILDMHFLQTHVFAGFALCYYFLLHISPPGVYRGRMLTSHRDAIVASKHRHKL